MIDYVDMGLFLEDSLDKQISIVSDDQTINITNEDIVGESVTIEESISSEDNLYFGTVESNCIKFTVRNTMPRMLKKWITVQITPQGASEPFEYGRYYVRSDKPSSDRSTRDIIAYDGLYKILTNTYKRWYNSIWANTSEMTVKQFRIAWFARLAETHPWLEQEDVTLPNDSLVLKKSKKIQRPSGRDIFKAICEINGCFGRIGRDNKFHYITLNGLFRAHEITKTYTMSVEYEDYNTATIDRVEILSSDGAVVGDAGASEENAENKYVIESNFMLKGIGGDSSSTAKDRLEHAALMLFNEIRNVSFTPFKGEFKGNPCLEVGDAIQCYSHNQTITTYILNRSLKGIQSLRDEYVAEGDAEYPEKQNTLTKQIKDVKQAVGQISDTTSGYDAPSVDDGDYDDFYIKYANKVTKNPLYELEYKGWVNQIDYDSQGHVEYTYHRPDTMADVKEMEWDYQNGGYSIRINGYVWASITSNESPNITANGYFGNPYFELHVSAPGLYKLTCDYHWSISPSSGGGANPGFSQKTPYNMVYPGLAPSGHCSFNIQGQDAHAEVIYEIVERDLQQPIYLWATEWFPLTPSDPGYAHLIVLISNLRIEKVINEETGETDGGIDVDTEKYIDAVYIKQEDEATGVTSWKEIEYVAGADTSTNSGLSLNYKRWLSLTPEVMRALVKADPPQADVDFYRYCIRYTGDPDKTLSLAYNTATSWTNGSVKVTKEGVYTIKSSGAYNSGAIQQIAYKIEGLTSGVKYWFNFWARFTGAEFGEDFRKGLGLVWSTSNSINTDDWEGDPHTYNDTTKYLSFYRVNGKRYYEAGVTATASTMYMILTVGDLTDGSNIVLTLGDMVISQTQKKYARSIYLYDVPSESWIRYKPFGMSDDDGESDISYLNELNDVEIDNPTDGQVLMWDATNQEWVNGTGGGSSDLDAIELTQAQYDQLTPQQKADPNKIYFLPDGGGSGGGGGGGDSTVRYDENTRYIQVYDHGSWVNAYRLPFFTKLLFETSQTINTTYTFTEDGDFIVWSSCCVNEPTSTSKVSTTATVVSSNTKSGLDSGYTRTCEYYVLRAQAGDTVTFAMTSYSYNSVGVLKITGLSLTEEEFAFTVDGHATLAQIYDSTKKYLTLLITSGGNRSISGNGNAIESWAEQYNSVDYIEYNGNTVNYDAYGYAGGAGAVIVFEVT